MSNTKSFITIRLFVIALTAGCTMQSTAASIPKELAASANLAVEMAATRLGVASEMITIKTVAKVTWPNGGLGCPKPGMNYSQALVPGYKIELEISGQIHHYHGRMGGDPLFCAQPEQSNSLTQDH